MAIHPLRGATRLVIDATRGVTSIVEEMHRAIGGGWLAAPVYLAIRGVTSLVGVGIDSALAPLQPLLPEAEARDLIAALNGVLGDYLAATENPLALPMTLRPSQPAGKRVLVLVHGSCMSDRGWLRNGHDHGAELARELGYSAVYVSYNSGLHISENGRALAALLESVDADELAILGHSMGGLVARSACRAAEEANLSWRARLKTLVCVGSPHHGAALERGGNLLQLAVGVSRYSAPLARLGNIRSAGVTDLRYGNVTDADWQGRDRFAHGGDPRKPLPLPDGVACYALAGSSAPGPRPRPPGDGLVSVDSALGRHRDPARTLAFTGTSIAYATGHLALLSSAEVYATIRDWLRGVDDLGTA
jgi:pimeloyl-ACP methyl ester carboxylesterase